MSAPKFPDDRIIQALKETKGEVYLAADRLGCDHVTIYRRMKKSKRVRSVCHAERGRLLDTAELAIHKEVLAGNLDAVKFVLSRRGKKRGWADKIEVEQGGSVKLRLVEEILDGRDGDPKADQAQPGAGGVPPI